MKDLIKDNNFIPVNTVVNKINKNDETILRVIKKNKLMKFDENTFAKLADFDFFNGTITVKVLSKLLPDAPDFARGFIGIVFRNNSDNSKFESFYVRPTNGRNCTDLIRSKHAVQYFSYPNYTFAYFRDKQITKYENSAPIALNEWITIKAIIHNQKAEFYLNDDKEPVLIIDHMIGNINTSGSIGLFVDIGTEGYFKDLKIKKAGN